MRFQLAGWDSVLAQVKYSTLFERGFIQMKIQGKRYIVCHLLNAIGLKHASIQNSQRHLLEGSMRTVGPTLEFSLCIFLLEGYTSSFPLHHFSFI